MAAADLYLDRVDFLRYLKGEECFHCGFSSCEAFVRALKAGYRDLEDCRFAGANKAYALKVTRQMHAIWPAVPLLLHPRPGVSGLVELNQPDVHSLVLISGNNEYTEQVLLTVLGTTACPFYVIFVDTDGNTVDMSMIYKTLTAERIQKAIQETGVERKVRRQELIIPGLAAPLKEELQKLTGWNVSVGPICAAELPLFLSEIWIPPER